VRAAFLPPLYDGSILRKEDVAMSGFTPIFATLSEEDIINLEKDRDKELKRKKRASRPRRGIVLPDREPLKTHRSLINPIGPDGHRPSVVTETIAAIPATSSRRAAAIAAQANINLLAQDLPIPQPPTPPPAQPSHRGRKPNARTQRGASREQSVLFSGEMTPSVIGGKRQLREDSVADTVSGMPSPLPPHKKRIGGRIDETPEPSMEPPTPVKTEADEKPAVAKVPEQRPVDFPGSNVNPAHMDHGRERNDSGTISGGMGAISTPVRTAAPLPSHHFEQPQNVGYPHQLVMNQPSAQSLAPQKSFLKDDPSEDSDSDSSDSDDDYAPKKQQSVSQSQGQNRPPNSTPMRTVSASGAITSPGTSLRKIPSNIEPPGWIERAQKELLSRYPQDRIQVVPKPKTDPAAPQEWRVKCLDWYV
jgi:SWI/SNF-related matrix-associated actin-dependent regulator of chromatin subfamily B protein 1